MLQSKLQKVDLETVTDDVCRGFHFDKVHTTNICAGVATGGKGQCTVSGWKLSGSVMFVIVAKGVG